jgi:NAD-dependent DNA ligase
MAVKFDPLEKQTIFRGYTYEVGQHGNITPMLHYDPVTFNGTIHTKSTGSSLKRFNDLALKYGDYINVTYVNDVMPYVSRVECDHNRRNTNPIIPIIDKCPICGSELVISSSGKTLLCPNMECPGRSTQRMVNMFSKLGIKGFADASFKDLQKTHLNELYTLSQIELINILGEADGKAFYQSLRDLVTLPQKDYMVMGSLGFTSIAYKKWQSILQNITLHDLNLMYLNCNDDYKFKLAMLQTIPGIGNITAEVISNEWKFFASDIDFILKNVHLENSYGVNKSYKGEIRFTGFRNSQLCEQLCNLGYDADDNASVTKKTDILLVPYEGFTSSKVQKAQKNPNCKIIAVANINSILEQQ